MAVLTNQCNHNASVCVCVRASARSAGRTSLSVVQPISREADERRNCFNCQQSKTSTTWWLFRKKRFSLQGCHFEVIHKLISVINKLNLFRILSMRTSIVALLLFKNRLCLVKWVSWYAQDANRRFHPSESTDYYSFFLLLHCYAHISREHLAKILQHACIPSQEHIRIFN